MKAHQVNLIISLVKHTSVLFTVFIQRIHVNVGMQQHKLKRVGVKYKHRLWTGSDNISNEWHACWCV